jgi:hypothetical protein
MTEPSALEKIASSLTVKGAANAVGVLGATVTPLAAFVPFLVDSLASGRQAQRLESMFGELRVLTEQNAERLKEMTDDQYKVVNEAISAAFYTINQEKIQLLKRAASNAFLNPDAVAELSDSLSRVIRDISSAEAAFVVKNFGFEMIVVTDEAIEIEKTLAVKPNSMEEIILSGLINLGLLYSKTSRWGTVAFEWSPLVVKLIRLLRDA